MAIRGKIDLHGCVSVDRPVLVPLSLSPSLRRAKLRLQPGLQGQSNAQVIEEEGQKGQGEITAGFDHEIGGQFFKDLVREIDVLAPVSAPSNNARYGCR